MPKDDKTLSANFSEKHFALWLSNLLELLVHWLTQKLVNQTSKLLYYKHNYHYFIQFLVLYFESFNIITKIFETKSFLYQLIFELRHLVGSWDYYFVFIISWHLLNLIHFALTIFKYQYSKGCLTIKFLIIFGVNTESK